MSRSFALTSMVWLALATVAAAADSTERVRAILTDKCLSCHSSDQKKGGLDLTRRSAALSGGKNGEAVVPGKPDESLLFEKVSGGEMPPKNPLSQEQVGAFKAWIESGAHYPEDPLKPRRAGADWWSLKKIESPPVPKTESAWVRTPIDAFVLAALKEHGLKPSLEADRRTMIRRASFDLLGLPPAPEEIDAFVRDPAPDAYERMIDRLLASPHYGERWGRHWLDVVRFGESQGYEMNHLRPNAWPYRDYVIRAFNHDTPLPRFILEQLAGDTLKDGDWLTQAATGFLVGGTHDEVGNATLAGQLQQRADDLDDILAATGTAFLGLTVQCARCHDHKFDPIAQKDYYGLQAVFAGVQHAEREVIAAESPGRTAQAVQIRHELAEVSRQLDAIEPEARPDRDMPARSFVNAGRNVERFAPVEARFLRITILATSDKMEPCIDELEVWSSEKTPENVALVAAGGKASASSEYPNAAIHKIAHLNDGQYGNGRSWISRAPGKGWAQVEWPSRRRIDRVVWGRDRQGAYKDRLAIDYYIEAALEPGQWHVIASSSDRQQASNSSQAVTESAERKVLLQRQADLLARLAELGPTRKIYAATFRQPEASHILRRGDPMQKGATVAPSGVGAISPSLSIPDTAPEGARRTALAEWLGDARNPLPARVMVNRVWHYHFGRGLVATPSDFGFNGGAPSHPALLDWLASEYIRTGFRLKPIHRLIMLSAAYRQSSRADQRALAVDKGNQWLWRMSPRRLEAEGIRDAILTTNGQLDPRMGGPGYSLWEKNTNYVVVFNPKPKLGPEEFRRMVYQFKPRSQQDPTFGAFDCPDAALVAPRRTVSTTALQALNLLNSAFLVDQSEHFATRLQQEAGTDAARQVDRGFALAFGRQPTAVERTAAMQLVKSHGTAAFCRALYNANEFLFVE